MKLVILAGGFGTRLGDRTVDIPKPMVQIGGKPILWHIMKIYSAYGINEFIICLGYKGDVIKDYFYHYKMKNNDFTIHLNDYTMEYHNNHHEEDWKVTLVDTGMDTLKGGRLKRIEQYLEDDINLLTYGDGVSDIDIEALVDFHNKSNKIITISGVQPPSRFGELRVDGDELRSFEEKPQTSHGLINGGFMVFNKALMNYLNVGEDCDLEIGAINKLIDERQVSIYRHNGLWACMDHERDVKYLNKLWKNNQAFWKVW